MGCGTSLHASQLCPESRVEEQVFTFSELQRRNREIERDIAVEKMKELATIKILILGSTGSGKTTIFKQMRIIHLNGFSVSDYINYRYVVHANAVQALIQLVEGVDQLGIDVSPNKDLEEKLEELKEYWSSGSLGYYEIDEFIADLMKKIWNSVPVQLCFQKRYEIDLLECAQLFLDDLDRISAPDYRPTLKDILYCRFRTTGICELSFAFKGLTLRMIDVGGQRSEQKKWIHCFDNVQLVMFVSSLSEYDQEIMENEKDPQNKMMHSLEIFHRIVRNRCFAATPFLLFLNKKDILAEKIKQCPLKVCFPDYKGKNSYEPAKKYILQKFVEQSGGKKTLYSHFTTATDTENFNVVFETSIDQILVENLASSGVA